MAQTDKTFVFASEVASSSKGDRSLNRNSSAIKSVQQPPSYIYTQTQNKSRILAAAPSRLRKSLAQRAGVDPSQAPPTTSPVVSAAAGDLPVATPQPAAGQQTPSTALEGNSTAGTVPPSTNSNGTQKQFPQGPAMGVIRYEVDASADNPKVSGGVSIFKALDEALVKNPRAAAIRSLLPVTQSELARATEQPPPAFVFDRGIAAEQVRRAGVQFDWEPPWKLILRLLVAQRMVDQEKLDLMAQLWQLRAAVRMAYTEVVVAQETLETLNSLYELANKLRIVSERRFKVGDVPELDLLKARLAESQYDVDRQVGVRRVIQAKQLLNIYMGRPPEQDIVIPRLPSFLTQQDMFKAELIKHPLLPDFSISVANLQTYIELSKENRYELKSIKQQILVNKANRMNAIGDIVPTSQFWIGSSVAGNPPVGPKLSAYYFGLNVPTNMTSFHQGDLYKYDAVGRQLRYQTGGLENIIEGEVAAAYNGMLAARTKLQMYEEHVLADSFEVARLAQRSYEVGQSDITSTIQAQQNNVQIRREYLEAIQLYQQAFTQLEQACGTPLLEEH